VEAVPFTLEMYRAASSAFQTYGKGRQHPAQLNFGDCMAYALAKVEGIPLLYKGEDFSRTDIRRAL
jgi:ribonuclease VapC